jgi:hypothetical protein
MPGSPRSGKDWYSPYFAPATILVAAAVLLISVQAGRLAGNLVLSRNRAQYAPPTTVAVPPANHSRAKPAHHRSPGAKKRVTFGQDLRLDFANLTNRG